jgi:hypothetical protein
MGRFMIPVCCVCGKSPETWHDHEWEDDGGLQDFCPEHASLIQQEYGEFEEYLAPHLREANKSLDEDDEQ